MFRGNIYLHATKKKKKKKKRTAKSRKCLFSRFRRRFILINESRRKEI